MVSFFRGVSPRITTVAGDLGHLSGFLRPPWRASNGRQLWRCPAHYRQFGRHHRGVTVKIGARVAGRRHSAPWQGVRRRYSAPGPALSPAHVTRPERDDHADD